MSPRASGTGASGRAYAVAGGLVALVFVVGLVGPLLRTPGGSGARVALTPGTAASDQGEIGDGGPPAGPAEGTTGATAPGVADGGGPVTQDPTTGGSGGPGEVRTEPGGVAPQQGVTTTAVRVGVPISDIAVLSSLGGGDLPTYDEQREAWDAFWAHHNATARLHGRRVVPVYRRTDPLDKDTMRAACEAFVKDDKVFAVATSLGLIADSVRCVSERFGVPLVAALQSPAQYFTQARGRYFATLMSLDRQFRGMIHLAHQRGFLKGRTIGVVTSSGDGEREAGEVIVPTLEALGYRVAKVMAHSTDPATGASQTPLEVQQMRAALVDVVVFGQSEIAASGFRDEARRQGYAPDYVGSDWSFAENTDPGVESLDSTFLWASFTHVGEPSGRVPAADQACERVYQAATGKRLDRHADGNKDRLMYRVTLQFCAVADLLVAGLAATGSELTPGAFSAAMQGLGPRELANTGPASLRQGKFDAPDALRPVTLDAACHCWRAAGEFAAF